MKYHKTLFITFLAILFSCAIIFATTTFTFVYVVSNDVYNRISTIHLFAALGIIISLAGMITLSVKEAKRNKQELSEKKDEPNDDKKE